MLEDLDIQRNLNKGIKGTIITYRQNDKNKTQNAVIR